MLPDYIARELTNIMTESCSSHCFWLSLLPHKCCNSSTQDPDDAQVALKSRCCGDFLFSAIPHKIDMSWACYLIDFSFSIWGWLVYGWNELQKIQYLQGELRKLKEAEIEDNEPGPLHVLSCGLAKVVYFRLWSSAMNTYERFMIREGRPKLCTT